MSQSKHAWMIRAGDNNELADMVWDKQAVAIGWPDMGDLSNLTTREEFQRHFRSVYPTEAIQNAGQLYRFAREIDCGDYAFTFLKREGQYLMGVIESDYEFNPNLFNAKYPQIRRVKWEQKRILRAALSEKARNGLGVQLTVFSLDRILSEIISPQRSRPPVGPPLIPPFRGLLFEPITEQGVVLLFGMVCRELGFWIKVIRTQYPDCAAFVYRNQSRGRGEEISIEFEFLSSNFRRQGHDPNDCDLIVCWEHDWPNCPVEVLELKSKIRELPNS